MSNTIKYAAIGVGAAGLIAGAVFGIRWFRARGADAELDLDNIDEADLGEPLVVAEEIVIVEEPVSAF